MKSRKSNVIDKNDVKEFLYLQIKESIKKNIIDGVFAAGSRLPSLDKISSKFNVNRLTVHRAIKELSDEGWVYSLPAKGIYVSEQIPSSENVAKRDFKTVGLLSHVLVPAKYGLYHQEIIKGITEELEKLGANMLIFACGTVSQNQYMNLVASSNVDAMVYMGPFDDHILENLIKKGPPACVVDYQYDGMESDCVTIDNKYSGILAAKAFVEAGFKNVAMITGNGDAADIDRQQGFSSTLLKNGITIKEDRIISGNYTREDGAYAMAKMLDAGEKIDGVFCLNDEMALGALDALHERGISVPKEIAVLGHDDIPFATLVRPRLSTIQIDMKHMGRMAIRILKRRFMEPHGAYSKSSVVANLIKRESF